MKFRKKKYEEPLKIPEDFNFICGDFEYKFMWEPRTEPWPYSELVVVRTNKRLNVATRYPVAERRISVIDSDLEQELNDFIAKNKQWITESMKELKYRIYLKDKTIIDCFDIREEKDKYILTLPGCIEGHFSFDEVDMIGFTNNTNKTLGCQIDSMALGLEPHKQQAMLRYIKNIITATNLDIEWERANYAKG